MTAHSDPPHARPPLDPTAQPFVGNRSVDDNLREAVQVALFAAIGEASQALRISVTDRTVSLSGAWPDRRRRSAGHAALRALPGLGRVHDRAELATSTTKPESTPVAETPLLHVTRYCGPDEPSTGAAIREAVATLDQFCSANDAPPPTELIVRYRNLLPGSVTLDIGCAASAELAARAAGELTVGRLGPGISVRHLPGPGLAAVLAEVQALADDGASAIWQRFPSAAFRPWHGHPAAPLEATLPPMAGETLPTPDRRR